MSTDTSEHGLERRICKALTGRPCDASSQQDSLVQGSVPSIGAGWICGRPNDYDRQYTVDLTQLLAFCVETQPDAYEGLQLGTDSPRRHKFLARLQSEVGKRGIIDVLRKGIKDGPYHVELFYETPSPGNALAVERYSQNRFSVTRQLRYSLDQTQRALDLCLFINGLPVATFELKNSLTKQTAADAVEQYKRDRDPREKLFQFGPLRSALRRRRPRCAVSARTSRARIRGSCLSIRVGRQVRGTRRIRTASRLTICGRESSPAMGSLRSSRTMPRS